MGRLGVGGGQGSRADIEEFKLLSGVCVFVCVLVPMERVSESVVLLAWVKAVVL